MASGSCSVHVGICVFFAVVQVRYVILYYFKQIYIFYRSYRHSKCKFISIVENYLQCCRFTKYTL